jgi:hypothetical protein
MKIKEVTMMTRRQLFLAAAGAALLSLPFGCVVAERRGDGRRLQTYYYYPDVDMYYYPSDHSYYWLDRGNWRHGERPPQDFYKERGWDRLELDYEPHTRHEQIKKAHPPGRYDGRDRDRERDSDRDRDRNR